MSKVTMDKKYRYRSGEPARVLCVDRPKKNAPIASMDSEGCIYSHKEDGTHTYGDKTCDLIEVMPEQELWINVYPQGAFSRPYLNRSDADHWASPQRIALHRVVLSEDTLITD